MAILERVQVKDENDQYYYFQTTKGLYQGEISEATGIIGPTEEEDYGQDNLSLVYQLIRSEIIVNVQVKIVPTGGQGKAIIKKLHANATKAATVADLVGKTWPVGKGAGYTIYEIQTPARVKATF